MFRKRRSEVKKYVVTLSDKERKELRQMVRRGTAAARKLSRGRILLKADELAGWTDVAIANAFDVGVRTVERLRQRFVEQGLEACLNPITQPRTRESLTAKWKLMLWHWLVQSLPMVTTGGRYACLLAGWLNSITSRRSLMKRFVRRLKKRTEAVAKQKLVHPGKTERSVRLPDGRSTESVPAALQ